MRRIWTCLLVLTALLAISCGGGGGSSSGGGGGSNPPPPPGPTGYSNASLNGHYVYSAHGSATGTTFAILGEFTADGAGRIISGSEDAHDSSFGAYPTTPFTGTYSVGSDGRGEMVANFSGGGTIRMRFALISTDKARLIEMSQTENATGMIQKQDAAATANLAGTYVFRFDGDNAGYQYSALGAVTASGPAASGTLTGTLDQNDGGAFASSVAVTGTYTVGAGGRGTATINFGPGNVHFLFYIVDASRLEIMGTDFIPNLNGYAVQQSGGPFSNAGTNGNFIFQLSGYTSAGIIREAGRFTLNGSGAVNSGVEDLNENGQFYENSTFTGTYSMAANGRAPVQLTYGTTTLKYVLWMTSPRTGILMSADGSSVESGPITLQQGTQSNATLNGGYSVLFSGYAGVTADVIAQVRANGTGSFTGTQDYNNGGTLGTGAALPGDYNVAANGRATGTLGGLPIRIYVADASTWYAISADNAKQMLGIAEKQQ
ncbi:MAG TPA: hypothetical protein VN622_12920 [Clostridia bacterium]|nr:hypothetical protein [Clostridia bacterium]